MPSKLRPHLTYANVVSSVCLFVVLSGSAYAAVTLSKNSVTSKHIKNGQVKRADIASNAVTSAKVANATLLADDFKAGQLPAGPKGDTGPPGPKGDTGLQGPKGDPGSNATINGVAAGGDLTGTYPSPRVGLVQAGAADQTEDEGFAFVLPPWDELANITTDGDADLDNTVRILNTGSQSITVRHPAGQATFSPGLSTSVNVGTLPSILIRSADGARSWLVTCADQFFGTQIWCHGVANRLG